MQARAGVYAVHGKHHCWYLQSRFNKGIAFKENLREMGVTTKCSFMHILNICRIQLIGFQAFTIK